MPEKLRHPGFFRRILFGERLSQESISEIEEYKAAKKVFHLKRQLRIFIRHLELIQHHRMVSVALMFIIMIQILEFAMP
jgi:hypothetical protein